MKKEIALLIRKFLLGKSAPEEDRQLDAWYGEPSQSPLPLSDNDWQEIRERIWYNIEGRIHKTATRSYLKVARFFAAAASVAVLLTASWWLFRQEEYLWKNMQSEQIIIAQVTEKTTTGEIKQIHLPDGTSVWLNNQTTLCYDEHFGEKYREVTLEGEAFFEVTRDTERPFIVRAGWTKTRVLGTSFNVKAYCDERQQITVATGLVGVEILSQDSRQQYRLRPSDRLTFNPDTKTVTRQQVNMDNLPAWKDNQLVFDRQPLWEVAKTLERKYGVSIRIPEVETAGRLFSGTFAGKDLPHILWAIEYSMNVHIERPGTDQMVIMNKQ